MSKAANVFCILPGKPVEDRIEEVLAERGISKVSVMSAVLCPGGAVDVTLIGEAGSGKKLRAARVVYTNGAKGSLVADKIEKVSVERGISKVSAMSTMIHENGLIEVLLVGVGVKKKP